VYNQHLLLTDSLKGRETEFDDWYVWVHIRDVMGMKASAIAAQCFRRTDLQLRSGPGKYRQRFLALYENSDPQIMTGHGAMIPADMLISSSMDPSVGHGGGYCDTVVEHTKAPGKWPRTDLITEWIEPRAATPANIEWYLCSRFPAVMRDPEVVSGWLGKTSDHQLYQAARPAYVAIYRTARLDSSIRAWQSLEAAAPAPWSHEDVPVMCFAPVCERVTRLQVLEPDAMTLQIAQAKRDAVQPRRP